MIFQGKLNVFNTTYKLLNYYTEKTFNIFHPENLSCNILL